MTDRLTCFLLGVCSGSLIAIGLSAYILTRRPRRRTTTLLLRDQND